MKKLTISSLLIMLLMITVCRTSDKNTIPDDKVIEIATKAYVFGYPMILMDYKCLVRLKSRAGCINCSGNRQVLPIAALRCIL
jgi:hypothetical protein